MSNCWDNGILFVAVELGGVMVCVVYVQKKINYYYDSAVCIGRCLRVCEYVSVAAESMN